MKKVAKRKTAAQRRKADQKREDKITKILSKVSEICDYAIENLCVQPAQMEKLEWMLLEAIR